MFFPGCMVIDTPPFPSSSPEDLPKSQDGGEMAGKAFPPRGFDERKSEDETKTTWWPNCTHPRYTKLAQRKFRDRLVILWKCRRCPKQIREVIDIDMNSREVFVKSTKSALPRKYDAE